MSLVSLRDPRLLEKDEEMVTSGQAVDEKEIELYNL
jgi:hypothetical protein